jgi:hypothetical protein
MIMDFRRFVLSALVLSVFLLEANLFVPAAHAASFSLLPAVKTIAVGQIFAVDLAVNASDQAMNAASANIIFPADRLRVLSISRANSVITLWVQNPAFSNSQNGGTISLQGIVVNPGFSGSDGNIVQIVFQAVAPGSATVSFDSGAILANDGKGTNIDTGMTGGTYTIVNAPAGALVAGRGPIGGIAVTSVPATNDQSWYALQNIQFNWNVPVGSAGVWYSFATSSIVAPPANARPRANQNAYYDLSSLPDGIWYFSIFSEENGIWLPAVVKILRLDRQPPLPFTITRLDRDPADPQPVFLWSTSDPVSGVSQYQVKIGDGNWFDADTIQQGSNYVLPRQSPGNDRLLAVRAIDAAGNIREEDILFTVSPRYSFAEWWYLITDLFSAVSWIIGAVMVVLVAIGYFLMYRLGERQRRLTEELRRSKEILERHIEDIKKVASENRKDTVLDRESASLIESTDDEIKRIRSIEGDHGSKKK